MKEEDRQTFTEYLNSCGIVARDTNMLFLYKRAEQLSQNDATILVYGESGVGKDCLVKFIHNNSERKHKPFVLVNCSAIPKDLFESELFGYDPGSFTEALTGGKAGLFESANGGTLFLNEIGEVGFAEQVKLLNFLETKQVKRIGSANCKELDVRIISATNRDLEQMVENCAFRQDLYYRLSVVKLYVPPLRERKEDILGLIEYFSNRMEQQYSINKEFDQEALEFLIEQPWGGNIRELQNLINNIYIQEDSQLITKEILEREYKFTNLLPNDTLDKPIRNISLKEAVAQFESGYISKAIAETNNLSEAAMRLGIDLATLNRKKKKYGIYKRWGK